MTRFALLATLMVVFFALVSGCDSAPTPLALANASSATVQTFAVRGGRSLDLLFEPMQWPAGASYTVSTANASMTSSATAAGTHAVSWSAAPAVARRLVGYLGSQQQAALDVEGTSIGGSTAKGPTSTHVRVECSAGRCFTAIEYDYHRSNPDGSGTTVWSPPNRALVLVDRLQLEVADGGNYGDVTITSPEPLQLTR